MATIQSPSDINAVLTREQAEDRLLAFQFVRAYERSTNFEGKRQMQSVCDAVVLDLSDGVMTSLGQKTITWGPVRDKLIAAAPGAWVVGRPTLTAPKAHGEFEYFVLEDAEPQELEQAAQLIP